MEISVAEAPLQQANYSCDLPQNEEELTRIEMTSLRRKPMPCMSKGEREEGEGEEEE